MPQKQPVLGPACKHAVRLFRAFRDKVVDKNSYVCFASLQHQWGAPLNFQCSVGAGNQTLSRRLFISRRSVNLAGKIQPVDQLRLERREELGWRKIIVFHSVARTHYLSLLQSGN